MLQFLRQDGVTSALCQAVESRTEACETAFYIAGENCVQKPAHSIRVETFMLSNTAATSANVKLENTQRAQTAIEYKVSK